MNSRDDLIIELYTLSSSYILDELRLLPTKKLVEMVLAEHKYQDSMRGL